MATPQQQLKNLDAQLKSTRAAHEAAQREVRRIQGLPPAGKSANASRARELAAAQKKATTLANKLKSLDTSRTKLQRDIWYKGGQYENLLKGQDRDAFMAIRTMFKEYGLESLSKKIYEYAKQGFNPATVNILLQDTVEYKKRFAANEERKKRGLRPLSPEEYLAAENAMHQVMSSAGLPVGFYDKKDDFAKFIGRNIDPAEVKQRVDMAVQATALANPAYRKALNQMGISDSQLTAYFLDPTRAIPMIQKAAATATIGAEAIQQGLTFDKGYAEHLATRGVGADQARAGYAEIAASQERLRDLALMEGESWTQREAEKATLEAEADSVTKRGKLLSRERGRFMGGAGGAAGGMAGNVGRQKG